MKDRDPRKRVLAALFLFIVLCAVHEAAAQYGTTTIIRGRVQSANGFGVSPLAGIAVTLLAATPTGLQPVSQTITGYDGMYYFQGISPGSYRIVATHPTGPSRWQDFQFMGPRFDVVPLQF